MKIKFTAFLIFFILVVFTGKSQTSSNELRTRYGGFLDFGLNQYSSHFTKLPGVPNCCPLFTSGSGFGFAISGLFEVPIYDNLLFSVRAGYFSIGGVLKEYEPTTVILANDQLFQGEFEHSINATLSTVSIEPMIGSRIFGDFFLYAGLDAGILMQKGFSQKEQITQPADEGVFTDTKTRTRNYTSGTIENTAGLLASLKIGASYELPLNKSGTLIAAPEAFWSFGLTNIVSGLQWKVNTLSLGVAVKYSPYPSIPIKEEFRKKYEIDTLTIKSKEIAQSMFYEGKPVFKEKKTEQNQNVLLTTEIFKRTDTLYILDRPKPEVQLTTYAIYENNKREKAINFDIKQQFVTQAFSMLPFVFFDDKSSELPSRYTILKTTKEFNIDSLDANPVVYNQNILNIIGRRMAQYQDAGITVTGYADQTTENGDCELANKRAHSVRSYLIDFWGIRPDRILVTRSDNNCTPEISTKTQNEYGYADNRQAMITCEDNRIMGPVIKNHYLETIGLPIRALEHQIDTKASENVTDWALDEYQKGDTLFNQRGQGKPDIIRQDITESFANSLESGSPLIVTSTIKDKYGTGAASEIKIPVTKDTSEFEVQRLTLAIFKVSGDILREIDKKAIQNFIKGLRPGDSISVVGYTDMLGEEAYNMNLSSSRAKNVCDYIQQLPEYKKGKAEMTLCQGVGFTKKPPQIYSYELPEERFLSRIVQIEIRRRWR
jgi:outer membrane protein OmpA-like peptidoglycan-associated protein